MTDLVPPAGFDDDVAVLPYRHPPASLMRSPARPAVHPDTVEITSTAHGTTVDMLEGLRP
ncbi:MAG: hypothetical protein WAM92_16120 [Mycobacterium sp.]